MTEPKRNEPVAAFTHDEIVEEIDGPTPPRPEWALSQERVPLFTYTDKDGDDVAVTMPAKPNPGLALQFLRQGRTMGGDLAVSWLIEQAIGEDGYERLATELSLMPDPENGSAVVQAIGKRVQEIVMGGLEGPKA